MAISTVLAIPCVLASPASHVPFSATKIKFTEYTISQNQEISCTSTVYEHGVVPKSEKGQPGAHCSCLRRVQPFWILCLQPFPVFLHETVSRT
jgi:hypothetical protein